MLTMLWLYLLTNNMINMSGTGVLPIVITFCWLYSDGSVIWSVCDRIRGKQE